MAKENKVIFESGTVLYSLSPFSKAAKVTFKKSIDTIMEEVLDRLPVPIDSNIIVSYYAKMEPHFQIIILIVPMKDNFASDISLTFEYTNDSMFYENFRNNFEKALYQDYLNIFYSRTKAKIECATIGSL